MRAGPATPPPIAAPRAAGERCPRCGARFDCGFGRPEPCACTTVRLDAGTLAALRRRYDGCLCLRCLQQAAAGDAPLSAGPPG